MLVYLESELDTILKINAQIKASRFLNLGINSVEPGIYLNIPGIRSDSDMTTMGYRFKPWTGKNLVAGGGAILDYLNDVVDENGFRDKIQYNSHVTKAWWKSDESKWYVTYQDSAHGNESIITCNFLYFCVGYYDYENGHEPDFEGQSDFNGDIIHPQHWPENLNYKDKNVVVIGSGATAVTLIPSMADETKHITMLQRSPTYYMVRPNIDPIGAFFGDLWGKQCLTLLCDGKTSNCNHGSLNGQEKILNLLKNS